MPFNILPEVKEEEPKKLKPCCACPETRKTRDECIDVMDAQGELYAELDLGNLCATNIVELKPEPLPQEQRLLSLATKGTQFLLSKIFSLPSEYIGCDPVVKLPKVTTKLPRQKAIPKANPLTKWQQFAKKKGITKQNKDKLVWDTTTKEWKPRYGYKSVKNTNNSDWLIEVPENADPNTDFFAKKKKEKSERVAKNEYQRLRNIAAASKVSNLESYDCASKTQLKSSLASTKNATASLGKFTELIKHEKPARKIGKKRIIPSVFNNEKESNLKQYEELMKKKPKLDINEAVDVHIAKKTKPRRPTSASDQKKKSKFNKKRHETLHRSNNKFNKKRNGKQ